MTYKIAFLSLIFLAFTDPRTLYNSLDPLSLSEHLAFVETYPNVPETEKACRHINLLLACQEEVPNLSLDQLKSVLNGIISLTNKTEREPLPVLNEQELSALERLGKNLPNRKLKGHQALTEDEVIALPPEEIDLARGLFLSEMGQGEMMKIRSYEAYLDLMALQIKSRLRQDATLEEKIQAINHYIFYEMGFRFPPHSLYAKDIDLYTFLPSVLDSRRGVCLGVSILYIALSQRLDLPLEMITPPGHIYIRARAGDTIINIETTARGINLDSKVYLGVDTRSLEVRNIKEVIGMAHFNQASLFWQKNDPQKAIEIYSKGLPYLQDDKLLAELMGYNYLLLGEVEKGREKLEPLRNYTPEHAVSSNTVPEDYLDGKVSIEGLKIVFGHVDENRASILKKKEDIEALLKEFPEFRGGWFQLAAANLQLHKMKEGLAALEKLHSIDPNDATAEYYLSVVHAMRMNYVKAWEHLLQAEKLTQARSHDPEALKELRKELNLIYPLNF